MSTARILVAIAGPSMNIVLALVIAGIHVALVKAGVIHVWGADGHATMLTKILYFAVLTNFVLFFFNLVPVPPLDGGHVAESFMPYRHRTTFENFARFGPFIVMAIVMISPLSKIFTIPAGFCSEHLYKVLGLF
jgi:Zn-dependent protease